MFDFFYKNIFFYGLKNILNKIKYSIKFNNIKIGHNVCLKDCIFGKCNGIYNNTRLFNCILGDYSYVSRESTLLNCTIGRYCSIGPFVRIGLGRHPVDQLSTHPALIKNFNEFLPTTIGNDVWIGANVIILDGCSIGNGSIIAAGSVVTKSVPDFEIWGGVPAKKIKNRFNDEIKDKVLNSSWWELDVDLLQSSGIDLTQPDLIIDELVEMKNEYQR
ncbi:CatB-related O-acetyltransferase [Aeromonas veronii]